MGDNGSAKLRSESNCKSNRFICKFMFSSASLLLSAEDKGVRQVNLELHLKVSIKYRLKHAKSFII